MLSFNRQAAQDKLNALVNTGRTTAGRVIEHVLSSQPKDILASTGNMKFEATGKLLNVVVERAQNVEHYLTHKHALNQMSFAAGIPQAYANGLTETVWGADLLARTLTDHFTNNLSDKTYLLRSLPTTLGRQEVRGFLSDKYRRIDSRPIVETFAQTVAEAGAYPYKGYVTDTKIALQAIFPEIYEPIPGELVAYGISLENSDFGNGALSLRSHMLRIWCDNLMVTEETMRQVHLGKRLDDATFYSKQTYELDAATVVSALKDVVSTQFSLPVITNKMQVIEAANAKGMTLVEAKGLLKSMNQGGTITKGEAERTASIFEFGGQESVPEGMSMWRLSNALSWVAGEQKDDERKLTLLKTAGDLLSKVA